MCKLFVAVALLAVAVYSAPSPPSPPTAAEVQAEMEAAGISSTSAAKIISIAESYKTQLEAAKDDHAAAKELFEKIKDESDAYIKTQSEADQTAYAAYVAKKKAEFESMHANAHTQTR